MRKTPLALPLLLSTLCAQQAPGPQSPIGTDLLVVEGRLVDPESDEPLRRCRVRLTGHQSTGYDLAWQVGDWADPPEQTTGDDGRFRFALRVPCPFEEVDRARYHLNVSHPQHLGWFSHCTFHVALGRGGVDYGDVPLPRGVRPRVRCVDTDGELQPGVQLYLKPAPGRESEVVGLPGGPQSWVRGYAYARTDIDGYLHLEDPLPPGEFTVEVRNRETVGVPDEITLPSRDPIEIVVAKLPPRATIQGQLTDTSGAAIGGALLRIGERGPSATTRRDGHFTLTTEKSDAAEGDLPLFLARNRRYDQWVPIGTVAWGARDVIVEIPADGLTTVIVVDADGEPVEDFNLYCLAEDRDNRRAGERASGTFRDGCARLRLEWGAYRLRVFPRSDHLLPSDWLTLNVDGSVEPVRVELTPTIACRVQVRIDGADARPAAGARVEALTAAPEDRFAFVWPATANTEPGRERPGPQLVAAAVCDDEGLATLRLARPGRTWLRVSGDDVATEVHEVVLGSAAREAPVLIDAAVGVCITGKLSPSNAAQRMDPSHDPKRGSTIYSYSSRTRPTLTLVHENGTRRTAVLIEAGGSFSCQGLPPGEVEAFLQLWQKVGTSGHRPDPVPLPLGTIELVAGAPAKVAFAVPAVVLAARGAPATAPEADGGR